MKPDNVNSQEVARPQNFVIGNDETESELSVESRSFLNRVNDQVRKRQKRSSMNVAENDEKHSMIWGMFMSVTLESAVFMVKIGESGHLVFRATSPLSRGQLKSKGGGKLSINYCADLETIETVFRTITSVNLLSLHGAVAERCEEYESYHDRTEGPVVGGQSSSSFVPSVIKTDVPLDSDDRAHKDLVLQKYRERIEKLSQQDKLSKFCMDTGFLNVVEIEQYFMTKDTGEFSQFTDSVACREYTLPRDEETSEPKGWIRGNIKIGPVLEVTTCWFKVNMELRTELCLQAKTILTRGSEFLMAQISLSRI